MRYGLHDDTVKRIAAVAYHSKESGNAHGKISKLYHSNTHPDTMNILSQAHTTDAMQHKFSSKDEENKFKSHIATAAAINRGTLNPVPEVNPMPKGQKAK